MHNYAYSLSLTLQPQYSHSISPITQPNGSVINHNITSQSISPSLSYSTPVAFTGGTFSLSSNLNYYSSKNGDFHNSSYSTNLFHVNYSQPIQFYNNIKWSKKNTKANYILSEYENITTFIKLKSKLCNYYLDALKDQFLIYSLNQQIKSLDTLVTIYKEQYQQGKIIKVELDELLFSQMDAIDKKELYQSRLKYSIRELNNQLNNIIIIDTTNLRMPANLNYIESQIANTVLKRKQEEYNNIAQIPWKKRVLETKHNRGIQMSINTGIGLNSSSETLSEIFNKKSPNVNISINAKIPISDFKERENQYQLAKLEWKQYQLKTDIKECEEENELEQLISNYNYLINNINYLEQKDIHLHEELNIKLQLLKSRKILFDEYNRSFQKIQNNINDRVASLNNLYSTLYRIELLTLFDFIENYNYCEMIKK